jgi:hypothetical protein
MRRYDIVSGILLILSIIDFALAAPLLGQEERQEYADMVHIPNDVRTALGKRWEGDLEKLGEGYLKTLGKPEESSTALASSSSVPSGPDHGSTNVAQPPVSNPASSTANPEPSSCSPSKRGLGSCMSTAWGYVVSAFTEDYGMSHLHGGLHDPLLYHPKAPAYTSPEPVDNELEMTDMTGAHAPQPDLNPNPNPHPSADPNFDWHHWINAEDPPPQGPVSPNGFGQAQVDHHDASTSGHAPGPPPPEPDEVAPGPLTNPDLDQASIYAAKGKAKESRSISGTARDVGNHAAPTRRDLQPADLERLLDPGE